MVVSRAGMGAVSELAAAGKPSILVPLPTASDQHQLRNAEAFEKAGAARLLRAIGIDRGAIGGRSGEVWRMTPGLLEEMGTVGAGVRETGSWRKRAADVLESLQRSTLTSVHKAETIHY